MNAQTAAAAAPTATPLPFIVNGDGTVTDTRTGLMWTQDDVQPEELNHADAMQACVDCRVGGYSDWRPPTVEELFLLADRSRHSPAIDQEAFPNCDDGWYWSSTADAASPADCAWFVSFDSGDSNNVHRVSYDRVRAVRVPASQSSASLRESAEAEAQPA